MRHLAREAAAAVLLLVDVLEQRAGMRRPRDDADLGNPAEVLELVHGRLLAGPIALAPALVYITWMRVEFLLTAVVGLGALSIDMFLPSLPAIAAAFAAPPATVQLTVTLFLMAFAASQLVYGPLSDRFGRRYVGPFSAPPRASSWPPWPGAGS
ncbi:MAG: MFS transporter [Candidatus Rokuibacteriota bacterium]